MLERIKRNRARLAEVLADPKYRDFSAVSVSRYRESARILAAHAAGRLLDVGCGHMVFRDLALQHAASYEGLDYEPRVPGVTYVTDVVSMKGVPREAFDTVLCFEVLEHVPNPQGAVAAMHEVLKPGGKMLVTAPHLSRLHEEPHDYYRYTGYGLRALAERSGFEVLEIRPHAGLASFLAHQVSTVLVAATWGIPVVQQAALALNRLFFVYPALWLDRVMPSSSFFPLGYVLVASKPGESR